MDKIGTSPVSPQRLRSASQPSDAHGPQWNSGQPTDAHGPQWNSGQSDWAHATSDMSIDCDTCPVRGVQCDDCVVSAILGPPELLDLERQAVAVLVERGLVAPLQDPRVAADRANGVA